MNYSGGPGLPKEGILAWWQFKSIRRWAVHGQIKQISRILRMKQVKFLIATEEQDKYRWRKARMSLVVTYWNGTCQCEL